MEKVYILVISSSCEYEHFLDIKPFDSMDKAKAEMNKLYQENKGYYKNDIIEVSDIAIDMYYDGEYDRDHYSLSIWEREIG